MLKILALIGLAVVWGVRGEPADSEYGETDYRGFLRLLSKLKSSELYNKVFRISDGFETYRIQSVPLCGKKAGQRCQNPVIEVADFKKGDDYVRRLPTFLAVAGFHGDEVVGTNSLFHLIQFISNNYFKNQNLYNLLANVRLLIVPMVNANGFYHFKRTETVRRGRSVEEVDPNRDFPFDQPAGQGCFVTSTAELLDALFRNNLIVGCLTFHGGANSITYPWGNFLHSRHPQTGDQVAFDRTAKALQMAAGANPQLFIDTYEVGTLHSVVYDVHGGFEDWAYGASFDPTSINTSCGVRENKPFELFKKDIHYDQTSNRAFVYLVEAGQNKRPPSSSYGSELPLASGDFSQGIWGHATRNINLSLVFAQIIGPHLVLEKAEFTDALYLHLKVYGCLRIDRLTIEKLKGKLVQTSVDERKNEYSIVLKVLSKRAYYPQIDLQLTCDQKWAEANHSQLPQTHLVRARTDSNYSINYKGFQLASNKMITAAVLNIRRDQLSTALIHSAQRNVFSLSYGNTLEAPLSSVAGKRAGSVFFRYQEGQVHVSPDQKASKVSATVVQVQTYGPMAAKGKQLKSVRPRRLLTLNLNEAYPMSEQAFLDLAGREVRLYNPKTNKLSYSAVLAHKRGKSKDSSFNALLIPPNGLSCNNFSEDVGSKDRRLISVVPNYAKNSLAVTYYQGGDVDMRVEMAGLASRLSGVASFTNGKSQTTQYETTIDGVSLADMRLVLARVKILGSDNKVLFTCRLSQRDPTVSPASIVEFLTPNFEPSGLSVWRYVLGLVLLSVVAWFAVMAYRTFRKSDPLIDPKSADVVQTLDK